MNSGAEPWWKALGRPKALRADIREEAKADGLQFPYWASNRPYSRSLCLDSFPLPTFQPGITKDIKWWTSLTDCGWVGVQLGSEPECKQEMLCVASGMQMTTLPCFPSCIITAAVAISPTPESASSCPLRPWMGAGHRLRWTICPGTRCPLRKSQAMLGEIQQTSSFLCHPLGRGRGWHYKGAEASHKGACAVLIHKMWIHWQKPAQHLVNGVSTS